jgi:hypothetical protein
VCHQHITRASKKRAKSLLPPRARIINLNRKARQLSAFSFVQSPLFFFCFSSARPPAAQISLSKHAQKVKLAPQKKFDALLQTINVKCGNKSGRRLQHLLFSAGENAKRSPTRTQIYIMGVRGAPTALSDIMCDYWHGDERGAHQTAQSAL